MNRPRALPPEKQGIFGGTYSGVPNPLVPFVHAYPTRYHGPIFTEPMPGYQYVTTPYQKAPFVGTDAMGQILEDEPSTTRILPSITGSSTADAVLGAFVGYFGAPTRKEGFVYAAAGALLGSLAGGLGIVALMGFEIYQLQDAGDMRPDLHGDPEPAPRRGRAPAAPQLMMMAPPEEE